MTYTVAVRTLCEFTAKRGDLDLRFTPAPSAQQGIAGHALVGSRRGPDYEREVPLCGDYEQLHVRGRADGYDAARNRLEEIKTHRGDLAAQPDNHRHLHWAQAKLYGHLLCRQRGLAQIELALVYFDIDSQRETVLVESHDAESLHEFFIESCRAFLDWARQESAHRDQRDRAVRDLAFPFAGFRREQRQLAEAVYKAVCTGRCLLAQAPTGIGKTLGTLFPILKALPGQRLDKLFFLAAKTPGRGLALDALALLQKKTPALPLRVLELTAREKSCEFPDKACHGESCPLARGFYDRLPAARAAALQSRWLDQRALREHARQHQVCPYYLAQELARWCDVVVGDYNYYFDGSALLHGLTAINEWRVAVLVDEAHNLVERARAMYSAELDQAQFAVLRREVPAAVKKALDRIARQWNSLRRNQERTYQAYDEPPAALLTALQQGVAAMGAYFAEHASKPVSATLQQFYFDALHFCRLADVFGDHSLFDINLRPSRNKHGNARLCLRNVVPAPFLRPRFEQSVSTILFSATLSPWKFYSDLIGVPEQTPWLDVDSPFRAEQLSVHIVDRVSTRFSDREASVAPIAALLARQFAARPGNYLAFFSSFDYLQQVAALLTQQHPEIPTWIQARGMDETERNAFMQRFESGGRGIGFAVLGGAFGEGIDLPGERLIGAFVATLGLPQLNPVNEQIRLRMDTVFGAGYDYTYLYPGLQKVIQAAGRVIRTSEDRGVLFLIDDRFARADVRRLLPRWWALA